MDIETAYQETLDYLYRFVDYSLTHAWQITPETFDLSRMRAFMAHLGNPQQAYPILHVAGTKGKGSISAMCASALQAAGYKVGLYTSPHLHDYAERIQLDGQPIAHADLIDLVEELKPALEGPFARLTTFEITTALAFEYFALRGATAVVAEVGLGGRLDATNIVTPRVAVIASLSLDHTAILGNTLAEIAGEKAGIIKPGVPVVLSPQQAEARQVVEQVAAERGAPLTQVGRDLLFDRLSASLDGQTLEVRQAGSDQPPVRLQISLLGLHQVENAATAYAALKIWQESEPPEGNGPRLSEAAIIEGLGNVTWPGRFEILRRNPPLVLDSAHNRDSARRLRETLNEYYPGLLVVLVFGASEDKDIAGMFAELLAPGQLNIQQVVATRSYHPRAMEPEKLVELAQGYNRQVRLVAAVEDALAEALRLAGDQALVLVTGSIFIVAGARETWDKIRDAPDSRDSKTSESPGAS
jgi:dihydrofolate synthase/folylpolyglutamate synthase